MERRGGDRAAPAQRRGKRGARRTAAAVAGVASLLVLGLTGYGWTQYHSLLAGLHTSGALGGDTRSANGDTNILIMGLDTRLDENGNALPKEIYDALHAGDEQNGGNNANVLMLLHVPGDGSKATSLSIPRDDYVDLPGCPDGQCRGKIKQAYGLAFDQKAKQLVNQGGDRSQREQQEREAGRKAEIDTVRQFLGGVPVDHFAEVTLVAFFQIAQVVQPITVCVDENTEDSYSGADFHQGRQQIDAEQAVAFVRQRRDNVHPQLNFTDLDREARQQAFISSLAYQLKQGGAFTDPGQLQGILDVAKQNTAVDSGLDLIAFAGQAANLTGGNITFVTLPIVKFGKDPSGEDVNLVDVGQVQAVVRQLIGGTAPAPGPSPSPSAGGTTPPTVDVVNSTSRAGLAATVSHALAAKGYTAGTLGTETHRSAKTVVYYGSGGSAPASAVAKLLGGVTTEHDSTVPAGHVRVVIGTAFTLPTTLTAAGGASPGGSPAPSASGAPEAPGPTGSSAPPSGLSGGGIPCVK
ncbi:LCP family protein [Amycolatopsis sp. PS_44_ISF1]|uniref:LCP family protein n=1 Tax=Amycolatopsis sp. PS_44_ISF1 TaxID=2974917 RepID=UPI0028DE956B|nr:LCP family protein [Amycolatopsis sp. PS_44_ISF1]MDT8915031.1 LCP family protein [Amycolatopsis sp. PS_44_ISF1]